ncbi:MAG: hypothetical protein MJY98_02035 [Fibrobacter sp.]|nr:hypothetical protein [Fibrobacter sp.]
MKNMNEHLGFCSVAVGVFALALGLAACGDDGSNNSSVESESSYGTMTDARDGQVYKTVKIGVQTWMAENLNYDYNVGSAKSFCYDNKSKNCDKYGRLYLWPAAMDSAGLFSKTGQGCGAKAVDDNEYRSSCDVNGVVQGVCPDGWHLPSVEEYAYLLYSVAQYYDKDHFAGRVLEAKKGWPSHYKQGTDNLGFAALPAGLAKSDGLSRESMEFSSIGSFAGFWTAAYGNYLWLDVRHEELDYAISEIGRYKSLNEGFSVRCVSNEYSEEIEDDLCVPSDSNIVKDTIVDSRDGQVYSIVTIGEQTWMAQNLNYDNGSGYAGCFEYDINNCKKYGRLYSKTGDGLSGDKANRIHLCPQGWHVPNNEEWNTLFDFVGGADSAGQYLKSSCYWKNGEENRDRFGFSVLPAGLSYIDNADHTDGFNLLGEYASFWSISETCDVENDFWDEKWDEFYYMRFDEHQGVEVRVNDEEVDSRYIRCIKD